MTRQPRLPARRPTIRKYAERASVKLRRLDQALADGELGEPGHRAQLELAHQVRPVRLDRARADSEPGGDLLGGVSLGDELEHHALTLGEEVEGPWLPRRAAHHVGQRALDGGAVVGTPGHHGLEPGDQILNRGVLEQIAVGASLDGALDVLWV